MKTILTFILILTLSDIFGQFVVEYHYPKTIDSLIIQNRTNEKVIVIQNNGAYRTEFWFDEQGNNTFKVYERLFVSSTLDDVIGSEEYSQKDSLIIYYERDTCFNFKDSTVCYSYVNNLFKSKKIIGPNYKYIFRGKVFIDDTLGKIFYSDTSKYIEGDLFSTHKHVILALKKNRVSKFYVGVPYSYLYLSKNFNKKVINKIIRQSNKNHTSEIYNVYYCKNKKQIPKHIKALRKWVKQGEIDSKIYK